MMSGWRAMISSVVTGAEGLATGRAMKVLLNTCTVGVPFLREVEAAMASDLGRGGEKDPPIGPAIIFPDMLQRLETDPLWAREYEDFVRAVSFAGPDEVIGFLDAVASCRRLAVTAGKG
jgi:hypothetical protein